MRPREAVREGLKLRVVRYSEQMFTALALPLALPQRPPMPPSSRRRSHRELKPANFFLHIKGGDELIIKILVGLIGLAGLAVIVALLSVDSLARTAMESSIRAQTGMEAQVGKVNVGFIRPTLRVVKRPPRRCRNTALASRVAGGHPFKKTGRVFSR